MENHRVNEESRAFVTGVFHRENLSHVSRSEVSHQSCLSRHATFELVFRVASGKAEVNQIRGGKRACSFGREWTFAIQSVVRIDRASLLVCCDGDSASEVADNEIEFVVGGSHLFRVASRDGPLVQRVPNAQSRHERRPADSCFRKQFINDRGISDISLTAIGLHLCKLFGNQTAQVAGVFAQRVERVVAHLSIHAIDAAGDGLCQSAASYDGIEDKRNVVFLQPFQNEVSAELVLLGDVFVGRQFFGLVPDDRDEQRLSVQIDPDLCGSGAGIDDQDAIAGRGHRLRHFRIKRWIHGGNIWVGCESV